MAMGIFFIVNSCGRAQTTLGGASPRKTDLYCVLKVSMKASQWLSSRLAASVPASKLLPWNPSVMGCNLEDKITKLVLVSAYHHNGKCAKQEERLQGIVQV